MLAQVDDLDKLKIRFINIMIKTIIKKFCKSIWREHIKNKTV